MADELDMDVEELCEDYPRSSTSNAAPDGLEDVAAARKESKEQPGISARNMAEEKVSATRALSVAELRSKQRWRWASLPRPLGMWWEEGGWDVSTREADGDFHSRFEVRESALMREVIEQNPEYGEEPAMGLYAARGFDKGEKVGVIVGEFIGRPGRVQAEAEVRERIARGGGRHIIELGRGRSARLLDAEGVAGYTSMQFANDARRMQGWHNNMELGEEGVLTALQRIERGTELLFAYDKGGQGGYWKRWGKRRKTRARAMVGELTREREQAAPPSSPPSRPPQHVPVAAASSLLGRCLLRCRGLCHLK